jgi:hypothetical protein
VHQIPVARLYGKGLNLIHLGESMSWKAEPSGHVVKAVTLPEGSKRNMAPLGGHLEDASTARQLNLIRRA